MKTFNIIRAILTAMIGLIMCSCVGQPCQKYNPPTNSVKRTVKFEYENHSYIYFIESFESIVTGVVHNPDCECVKKMVYQF